jgi:hypothetical protein
LASMSVLSSASLAASSSSSFVFRFSFKLISLNSVKSKKGDSVRLKRSFCKFGHFSQLKPKPEKYLSTKEYMKEKFRTPGGSGSSLPRLLVTVLLLANCPYLKDRYQIICWARETCIVTERKLYWALRKIDICTHWCTFIIVVEGLGDEVITASINKYTADIFLSLWAEVSTSIKTNKCITGERRFVANFHCKVATCFSFEFLYTFGVHWVAECGGGN